MNGTARGSSSVALKYVMAISGLLLLGFVIAHLLGNLQLFLGRDALNTYAANLQALGPLLWVARLGLLAILIVHVATAVALTRRNAAARPVAYAVSTPLKSTYASRTMVMSGLIVLAFVAYHLAHFTFGAIQPGAYDRHEWVVEGIEPVRRHDVYGMVVAGFSNPAVALSYVVAMVLLGLHLSHGVASFFQSMGWIAPRYRGPIEKGAYALTAAIVLGNCAMPLAVLAGLVGGGS